MRNTSLKSFPNQFQRESLKLINSLLELSSSVFYLVKPDMRHLGIAFDNMTHSVQKDYLKNYRALDPLNPAKFAETDDILLTIDSQMPAHLLRRSVYYQEFMLPNNQHFVADMFFRREGNIIAVLSMLRNDSLKNFTPAELELLRKQQPFLEYALNAVYLPQRVAERQSMEKQFGLTRRELDVLEQLICGASNKAIAADLGLGLPTVKTHILHIFKKTGVSSRSELLTQALRHLGTYPVNSIDL